MALVQEPHNSIYPRFCQDPELNKAGLWGVRRVGLVWISPNGEVQVRLGGKREEWPGPRATKLSLFHILPRPQQGWL